jgi:hypothetical protein
MDENHDHPIHKFPPEIDTQIFIRYSPSSSFFDTCEDTQSCYILELCVRDSDSCPGENPRFGPHFAIGAYHYENNEAPPQLVTESLERSANLPLIIEFQATNFDQHWNSV